MTANHRIGFGVSEEIKITIKSQLLVIRMQKAGWGTGWDIKQGFAFDFCG